jgi:hypothetical protein
MLQKICRVMLALGADDHAVPVKAIHAKLIQGRFFVPEARPLAEVIRAKTWNTDRLFRSSPERGEYTLRPAGIALARTRHRAPLPPWDRCELLGEEPMHEIRTRRANAGRLNAGDFFGSPTFLEEVLNSTARPLPTMRALASADARARLRIGLASAMQKRGVSPRCCRVLFGRQAVMFLNGYHRTLGRTSFGVACRTLRVSPAVLLLEKLTTVEVRDIAAGIDFESVSTTAKSRAAIVRLQAAAERHRLHLIEMDTSR